MKIKEIISQHRRDFTAIYECEHCSAIQTSSGYDDRNFHHNVIPEMRCKSCGEKSPETYRANGTKYPEGYQV